MNALAQMFHFQFIGSHSFLPFSGLFITKILTFSGILLMVQSVLGLVALIFFILAAEVEPFSMLLTKSSDFHTSSMTKQSSSPFHCFFNDLWPWQLVSPLQSKDPDILYLAVNPCAVFHTSIALMKYSAISLLQHVLYPSPMLQCQNLIL